MKDFLQTLEPPGDAPAPAEVGPLEDLTGGITGTATHPESGPGGPPQPGAGVVRKAPVDAGEACVRGAAGAAVSVRSEDVPGQGPWPGMSGLRPRFAGQRVATNGAPVVARVSPRFDEQRVGAKRPTPSPECIDVKELGRFKVRLTDDHVKGNRIGPWDIEMVCVKGAIYPHGGSQLQAYTARSRTRNLLKAMGCVKVHQDGDFETAVVFDVQDFARVAEVMRPRKRRPAPVWMIRGRAPSRP